MEAQSSRSSIFVLDPDPYWAEKVAHFFANTGGEYDSSPTSAFQTILRTRPRILVARMSLVSGKEFAFLRSLRKHAPASRLSVIVVANNGDNDLVDAAKEAGATQVLVGADVQATIDAVCEMLPEGPCPDYYPDQQPANLKDLYIRACRRISRERYGEAVADLKVILQKKPHAPEVVVSLAVALRHLGKKDAADTHLKRAAMLFALAGKDAKAKDIYDQLAKSDPTVENPFLVLAERRFREGRPVQAMKIYERASDLWPRNIPIKSALVAVYEELAKTEPRYESLAEVLHAEIAELQGGTDEQKEWLEDEEETLGDGAMQFVDEVLEDTSHVERRRAPRVPLVMHSLRYDKYKEPLPAVDVSMTGIGFKPLDEKFEVGQVFQFDLSSMGEVDIRKVTAQVVRVTPGVVGAQFKDLGAKQIKRLEKLCEG